MSGLVFANPPAAPTFQTGRADVACFVGLVRRLSSAALPASQETWLRSLGFGAAFPNQPLPILHVPVLLETYAGFTSLFDDGSSGAGNGTDYVAAAVRSFFAQGGKRCYVVRVGDPVTAQDSSDDVTAKLTALLPNTTDGPEDVGIWTGVGCLGALEDVSFLVTPDLPILSASKPAAALGQVPVVPTGPEAFVECSQGDITPQQNRTYPSPAPCLNCTAYGNWAMSIAAILNYLAGGSLRHQLQLREIQFVAAFPLPQDLDAASAAEKPPSLQIAQEIHTVIGQQMPEKPPDPNTVVSGNISSAFLQLAYPWLKTTGSGALLEALEPPDGALAGLLARNALTRGTFTSATKIVPAGIYDVWPALPEQETKSATTPLAWNGSTAKPLIERLSLFGFTPAGLRLLSDVTAYPGETYRSAPVNRLVSVICRAARRMGESAVFQSNGPALWGRVQRFLQNLMTRLWSLNALDGASAAEAFSVRCDRSTMTQNDLDNGRLLAEVTFTAAATIEVIRVKLAIEAGTTSAQEISVNLAEAS